MQTNSTQALFSRQSSDTVALSDWNPSPKLLTTASLQNVPSGTPLIAQQFEDNLFNNFQGSFNHFVESGQVWALLLGVLIGYVTRSLTAY